MRAKGEGDIRQGGVHLGKSAPHLGRNPTIISAASDAGAPTQCAHMPPV